MCENVLQSWLITRWQTRSKNRSPISQKQIMICNSITQNINIISFIKNFCQILIIKWLTKKNINQHRESTKNQQNWMGNYKHQKLLRMWGFVVKLCISWIVSIMEKWIKVIRGRDLECCKRLILTPILGSGKIIKQKEEVLFSSKIHLYFLPTSTEILFQGPSSTTTLPF